MEQSEPPSKVDVLVLGGGIGGIATSIHLARRGFDVAVVEPQPWPRDSVGESFDLTTPRLLARLGVPREFLFRTDAGVDKTALEFLVPGVGRESCWPPEWFHGPPIWASLESLHADRRALDHQLAEVAKDAGVRVVAERVVDLESDARHIRAASTHTGRRISANWFIDAAGRSAQVLARHLALRPTVQGPRRVAYWTRLKAPPQRAATTIGVEDPDADRLEWVWEIPLNSQEISVGCVMSPATAALSRRQGRGPREIFVDRLRPFPRLLALMLEQDPSVASASFVPSYHNPPMAENWVLVGDAAAVLEPLTANGVTSALRDAELAADAIRQSRSRGHFTQAQQRHYRRHAVDLPALLNEAMERLVYSDQLRTTYGIRRAAEIYSALGISLNSVSGHMAQTRVPSGLWFTAVHALARGWISLWSTACRLRRSPPTHVRPEPPRSHRQTRARTAA